MLENKLSVLKALNTTVDGDNDERLTFNVQGTQKAVQIDLNKLKEAITFLDTSVEEKQAAAQEHFKLEDIDITSVTEEEFLEKAIQLIGEVKKENKILSKDSFMKIFKYTGDFAKIRSQDIKARAQSDRCSHFEEDHKKYLEALKQTVIEEE